MKFIDSDFIISAFRGNKAATLKYSELKNEEVATTVVNEFELLYGAKRNGSYEMLMEHKKLLSELRIFGLDSRASEKAAEIQAELAKTGSQIDVKDLFIAAIVLCNNGTLLTRNVKHFERIRGMKVEKW